MNHHQHKSVFFSLVAFVVDGHSLFKTLRLIKRPVSRLCQTAVPKVTNGPANVTATFKITQLIYIK